MRGLMSGIIEHCCEVGYITQTGDVAPWIMIQSHAY